MPREHRYESLERWTRTVMLIFVVVVLCPPTARAVVANPSIGNWFGCVLAVIVVVGSAVSAASAWKNRSIRGS